MATHANPDLINGLGISQANTAKTRLNQLVNSACATIVKTAHDIARNRQAAKDARNLKSMDERLLKDVGIERQDIDRLVQGNPMHLHY